MQTCMVSVRVEVSPVVARVRVVLVQGLSLPLVHPWVVLSKPVAVLHLCLPGQVHQLGGVTQKTQVVPKPPICYGYILLKRATDLGP